MPKIASVYLSLPLDQSFYYLVDDDTPLYARVEVPLRQSTLMGVVGALHDQDSIRVPYVIRPAERVLDKTPIFGKPTWQLAQWISAYYVVPLGEVIMTMLPKAKRPTPLYAPPISPRPLPILNPEQKHAHDTMAPFIGHYKTFLLHGVTGSGKTEVYKHLVAACLERQKSALILLPEIALTPQMLERFSEVFGDGIALYHSRLSVGERLHEWLRCHDGRAKVVIGPRSAVFLPLPNLGLIIIDEEHESSYKSQESPRYHARQVAFYRAQTENALLVLGSATPQIETYYYAQKGNIHLLTLSKRHAATPLPAVHIVDLKQISDQEKNTIISQALLSAMLSTLSKKRQVLLFLNRRGFAPVIFCADCAHSFLCPQCDITLTLHKKKHKILCHHCGHESPPPDTCPQCYGTNLKEVGLGTERLEAFLEEHFHGYKTVRLDLDTTTQKHSFHTLLQDIRHHTYDIIIGTQMMAKGHDIEKLDLVGVIMADIALQIPDFRSSERTFVLITQVIGRAGRRKERGEAYIQTFLPNHPAITHGATQDYTGFYQKEIEKRQQFHYPPFVRLGRVVIRSENITKVKEFISIIAPALARFQETHRKDTFILGPLPCPIEKLKNNYRYHILIKSKKTPILQAFFRLMKDELKHSKKEPSIYLELDLDPFQII